MHGHNKQKVKWNICVEFIHDDVTTYPASMVHGMVEWKMFNKESSGETADVKFSCQRTSVDYIQNYNLYSNVQHRNSSSNPITSKWSKSLAA